MIRVAWLFYFSKYIELLDTVRMFLYLQTFFVSAFCTEFIFYSISLVHVNLRLICFTQGILCAEEETKPDHVSPRIPSLFHALDMVVGHHLDSW